MKQIIEQIKKLSGVKTVEPAGENMAVVVFEPEKHLPFFDKVRCVRIYDYFTVGKIYNWPNPVDDCNYTRMHISQEGYNSTWKYYFEPVYDTEPQYLKPKALVKGKIYVDEGRHDNRVIRFKKLRKDGNINIYSQYVLSGGLKGRGIKNTKHYKFDNIRHATPEEKELLINFEESA